MRNENDLGYHAPIVYSAEHRGYEYDDPDYSISGAQPSRARPSGPALRNTHLASIPRHACVPAVPVGDWTDFRNGSTPPPKRDRLDQHVQFEQAPKTLGTEHIAVLMSGISEKQAVRFNYSKFTAEGGQQTERCIEPYLLKRVPQPMVPHWQA